MLTGLKELDLMLEVSICRVGSEHHRSMALSVLDCLHQGQCARLYAFWQPGSSKVVPE